MLSELRSYLGQRVWEAGCGIGNFTELLLDRERLVCVDNDPFYVEMIDRRFGHMENVDAREMDLSARGAGKAVRPEAPDTIISLNVLEHIERDQDVLNEFFDALTPGGHAVVLVPANPNLYSDCDRTLGHFRRYTGDELSAKFRSAGFHIASCQEFNRLGTLGWWLSKKLHKKDLSPFQMRVYEFLLPIAKIMDRLKIGPGLSLIIVGQKPIDAEGAPAAPGTAAESTEPALSPSPVVKAGAFVVEPRHG